MVVKRDLGALIHALVGFGLAIAWTLLGAPGYIVVAALASVGYMREWWQHDLRLTVHQHIEAAAWAVGGVLGFGLVRWWL